MRNLGVPRPARGTPRPASAAALAYLEGTIGTISRALLRGLERTSSFGPDWLAGHIGLEPANPSASYLIGIAWQLRLRSAQLRRRRPFACELRDKDLQLRRSGRFQHE